MHFKTPHILVLAYGRVRSVLFVCFEPRAASEWVLYDSIGLGTFENTFVSGVCLPIWQGAAENKPKA